MEQLVVVVEKLNKRSSIPATFADKTSIVGVVNKGFQFLGQEVTKVPNGAPGKWYTDRDGYFYWGNGLSVVTAGAPAPAAVVAGAEPDNMGASVSPAAVLQSFSWFNDLGIANIWQQFGTEGEDVTVAVVDTGYNFNNADLSPAVTGVTNLDGSTPAVAIGDVKNPLIQDVQGHGTFCGSVICNRNIRNFQLGIAPKSKLLVAKISNGLGLAPTGVENILSGIEWAIQSKADIISVSFGLAPVDMTQTPDYVQQLQERLSKALAGQNLLIFAACGDNDPPGAGLASEFYPASFDGCISVGSTDNGQLSDITVRSDKTIIHAQGINVESYTLTDTPVPLSGTSMSTPMVAGVAALAVAHIKSKNGGNWNAADLQQKIFDTADPIPGHLNKKLLNPAKLFNEL